MAGRTAPLEAALAGRYTIERELGAGATANVYLAHDIRHDRKVALKVLRAELAAALGAERFLNEIKVTARLNHPHIVPLHDSGNAGGFLYYVMPAVEGESLRQRLERERRLELVEALEITRTVADALDYAHSRNVVHRDIKPENILMHGSLAQVADFGIAAAIETAGGERLTATGMAIGTPSYMSPEQATGDSSVGPASDLYSLATVLYEMLVGEPPFTGPGIQALTAKVVTARPPRLAEARPGLPASVDSAVERALSKNPAERFATAAEFARALTSLDFALPTGVGDPERDASAALVAARVSTGDPLSRPLPTRLTRRWPTMVAGLVAATAVLAIATSPFLRSANRIDSVAVLPLDNRGDSATVYFTEAMHASIIGELGRIRALRVISPTSVARYGDTDKPIQEIASELGVDAIVQGSVFPIGGKVRIEVQLFRALPEEREIWSRRFDGDLKDMLALQTEVARGIADGVRVTLTPEERERLERVQPPVDPRASEAYARGRFEQAKSTAQGLNDAIDYFEQAIEIEPEYALAYAGLADAYQGLPYYAPVDPREAFPQSREAAQQAIDLDPSLAGPYSNLAWIAWAFDWDWESAGDFHRRALALQPSYAMGRMRHAWYLMSLGRFDEAVAEDLRAREADPVSPRIMAHLGLVHYLAGDYERALEVYRETIARFPGFARVYADLGRLHSHMGEYDLAIAAFQKVADAGGQGTSGGSATSKADLAIAYVRTGRSAEALAILRELEEAHATGYHSPLRIAGVYAVLDNEAQVFHWLERAYEVRDNEMMWLKINPSFKQWWNDPRYVSLLRRMGYPGS
jgi:serine/threonine protein kinase/tetratricopeptide (TPR) repeat protein